MATGCNPFSWNPQAIAFFKMRIGWHGLGVLAMAVSLTDSHGHPEDGHPEDGQSVAPQTEKGDCTGGFGQGHRLFQNGNRVPRFWSPRQGRAD